MIFDTISVKVHWEKWYRRNCDLRVLNAWKQAFSVIPKASPWCWKSCALCHSGKSLQMASSHRITDLEKIPVRISKDEAPTPLSVLAPLFVSFLLFHLSRTLLGVYFLLVISSFLNVVRCMAFQSFLFCLLELSQLARPHQGACLLLGVLFSQFILVCFIICKNEKVLFVLVQKTSDFVASLG